MNTKILVTVRDRFESTRTCINHLIYTTKNLADIYIFDDRSEKDFDKLSSFYTMNLKNKSIKNVIYNTQPISPEIYWGKSYAINIFMDMLKYQTAEEKKYIVIMDNDICVYPDWLTKLICVFEDTERSKHNINILSCWNSVPKYDTIKQVKIQNEDVDIRSKVGSPMMFFDYKYWMKNIGTLPFSTKDAEPDDVYVWNKMNQKGHYFGVLTNNLARDITPSTGGSSYSARLKYVGKGFPK